VRKAQNKIDPIRLGAGARTISGLPAGNPSYRVQEDALAHWRRGWSIARTRSREAWHER
jgi:hypothetical protein